MGKERSVVPVAIHISLLVLSREKQWQSDQGNAGR